MSTATATPTEILDGGSRAGREQIVELLTKAYWLEIETVTNYIASSVNPKGARAEEVKESLLADVKDELRHAQALADRIKGLDGVVPGSAEFEPKQGFLQPPERQTDVAHVVRGVVKAETAAIVQYERIIEATQGVDPETQGIVTKILRDERRHRRRFEDWTHTDGGEEPEATLPGPDETQPAPSAAASDRNSRFSEGARVVAAQIAATGSSREETAKRMRQDFGIKAPKAILDELGV